MAIKTEGDIIGAGETVSHNDTLVDVKGEKNTIMGRVKMKIWCNYFSPL